MTREEFDRQVGDLEDLYYFCCRNDYYDLIEDYRHVDDIDEYIDSYYLMEDNGGYSWRDLANTFSDLLYEVDNYTMFYVGEGYVQGISLTGDDYYDLKHQLYETLCSDGVIEDDERDEEDEDEQLYYDNPDNFVYEENQEDESEDDDILIEEEFSILDVIDESCDNVVQVLRDPDEEHGNELQDLYSF